MKNNFIMLIVFLITSALPSQTSDQRRDSLKVAALLKGYSGAFVMYDRQSKEYFRVNKARCAERFSPASTFKIPNSLIGLESGVIADENFTIKWDGIKRWNADWNKEHTLTTAIKYSVVPYYQELARRVGRDSFSGYLERIGYGNKTIGEEIDTFWLDNSLKISADEQIDFLKRFYECKLPFSERSINIVKKIFPEEKYPNSLLKFKTGAGTKEDGKWLGWIVGYVEKKSNVYLFALNIEAKTYGETRELRDNLSRKILTELKMIE